MIKKLHFIKEDYSSDIEKYCVSTFKKDYPDFEFNFWKPSSSPLRILYDNGGLFIGPGILSTSKIPESYFDKSFLIYNNIFESTTPNINLCCYSNTTESPVFLSFMQKGIIPFLKQKGFSEAFKVNSQGYNFNDINILPFEKLIGFDKLSKEIKPNYLIDTNTQIQEGAWHIHYLIIDKNSNSNNVYSVIENMSIKKNEDKSNHFILLICNCLTNSLSNDMANFLNYKLSGITDKKFNVISFGDNIEGNKLRELIIEYIGRRFDKVLSCEKIEV